MVDLRCGRRTFKAWASPFLPSLLACRVDAVRAGVRIQVLTDPVKCRHRPYDSRILVDGLAKRIEPSNDAERSYNFSSCCPQDVCDEVGPSFRASEQGSSRK